MESIDKINLLLAKNGMTGAELSRKIGVSNSVYSQWNTKVTKPSNKSLSKISEFFNIDISEIMPDVEDPDDMRFADELVALLSELRDDEYPMVVAFIKGMIANRKA